MVILFIVGLVLVVGVAAWLGHQAEVARREALGRVARASGMSFSPEPREWSAGGLFSSAAPLAPFAVFEKGHSRRSCNHMAGELRVWDREIGVTLADYRYRITSGSGKHRSTRTYETSFLLARLPFPAGLPDLRVRREGFGDKIAAAVGFDDIDFESDEFSRRFHVSCADRRFAYNLIDPRMLEHLLDIDPPDFEIRGDLLLLTPAAGMVKWEPESFEAARVWTRDFLARWPEFVVKDLLSPR